MMMMMMMMMMFHSFMSGVGQVGWFGLLTGHADLNRHLYVTKVGDDELCPFCQEEQEEINLQESSLHFLAKCIATTV